ncbi:hypothetical protein V8G54_000527 [Vigna mungo]|uniref:Uncharacterized protein n=1 Tax=Vigna mungo TaxID=3915 RepID=A0AAQ3P8T5_VIGMU
MDLPLMNNLPESIKRGFGAPLLERDTTVATRRATSLSQISTEPDHVTEATHCKRNHCVSSGHRCAWRTSSQTTLANHLQKNQTTWRRQFSTVTENAKGENIGFEFSKKMRQKGDFKFLGYLDLHGTPGRRSCSGSYVDQAGASTHNMTVLYEFVERLGEDGDAVEIWGSIVGACKNHGYLELGKVIARKLLNMELKKRIVNIMFCYQISMQRRRNGKMLIEVKFLLGFEGPLPFVLEIGYEGVGESEDEQTLYYCIESDNNPKEEPLLLWLSGGPGPLSLKYEEYNEGAPNLIFENNHGTREMDDESTVHIVYCRNRNRNGTTIQKENDLKKILDRLCVGKVLAPYNVCLKAGCMAENGDAARNGAQEETLGPKSQAQGFQQLHPHFPHSCLVSLPNEATKGMTSGHADATPPPCSGRHRQCADHRHRTYRPSCQAFPSSFLLQQTPHPSDDAGHGLGSSSCRSLHCLQRSRAAARVIAASALNEILETSRANSSVSSSDSKMNHCKITFALSTTPLRAPSSGSSVPPFSATIPPRSHHRESSRMIEVVLLDLQVTKGCCWVMKIFSVFLLFGVSVMEEVPEGVCEVNPVGDGHGCVGEIEKEGDLGFLSVFGVEEDGGENLCVIVGFLKMKEYVVVCDGNYGVKDALVDGSQWLMGMSGVLEMMAKRQPESMDDDYKMVKLGDQAWCPFFWLGVMKDNALRASS